MPVFEYQGRDAGGNLVKGESTSVSADSLSAQLLAENIVPVKIVPKQEQRSFWQTVLDKIQNRKITNNDLSLFTRQMYTLLKSGVSIISTVHHLAETAHNKRLSQVLQQVSENLESGQSLSMAMQHYPGVFSPLMIGMIHVGENTGRLDEVFLHLTNYLELEGNTVKRVKAAIRYPSFVILAIIIGMSIITIFVVPVFAKMYARAHVPLPRMTIMLIDISNFFIAHWSMMLVFIIVLFVGLFRYISSKQGKLVWHQWQLKFPVIGILLKRTILLRFAQTFSIVANSGIPIVDGLSMVAQSIDNLYARQEIIGMRESIQNGNSIVQSAHACKLFTSLELQMLVVAEETGELGAMLNEIASYYQREVDYDLKKLTDMIEPILLIIISIMVLLLALAVYLPIWNMVKLVHH